MPNKTGRNGRIGEIEKFITMIAQQAEHGRCPVATKMRKQIKINQIKYKMCRRR